MKDSPLNSRRDLVILVDEDDRELGLADKLIVHRQGLLHRAVSVFLFNASGEILMQRRARSKYHSPDLLSNSCCTHPLEGEYTAEAGVRRLQEELGVAKVALQSAGHAIYRLELGNGMIEHELDHLFTGFYDGAFDPDPYEVSEVVWQDFNKVHKDIVMHPESYTAWFRILLPAVFEAVDISTGSLREPVSLRHAVSSGK
ncbi:isopentenyl-diphosphate Delta-isomerase [bacterium]|nr:isopentenyl-diphosphate Delta-isomerase [bacterium]